ncbi:alpha amylase C-terminal domain-containing protein [bacterium]|nr:alpha amylase C-terminal domain-containing protein [bacterium]
MIKRSLLASCLLLLPVLAAASAPDDNVEWGGVSHVGWLDREPLCPVDGESFTVRFQTYANDLTAARVHVDDGSVAWVVASQTGARGPYDVWSAQIPATASMTLSYYLELTDGADTDYLSIAGMVDTAPSGGSFVIDYTTLDHAPVGATPLPGGGSVFKVWSPDRTTADVRGEFNAWSAGDPLTRVGEHFVGRVADAAAGQMYKYVFNGTHWNTDARARSLNPSDNYNAHIVDAGAYAWQVADFDVPDFEEMVVYQLHVGTFSGRNDPYGAAPDPGRYVDVTARVPHLAELGVNVVMLNPITEFPWDYSAGYNPVTQWSPEWKYGSPDDFKAMIDTFHAHGIAVILDIVWNHFSNNDNFLWNYDGTQTYFDTPAVWTPWGDQADFDTGGVRDYFAESARLWLDEYRLDGFRMDATSYMNIDPQAASGWSLMQRLNDEMDNRHADKIAIAEQLPDNSWVTRPTSLGGAGFDAQYYDAFTDQLRSEILDAAAGDPEMWRIMSIVNGSGTYLEGRRVVNYLELHDEAWPTSGGQRIVKTIDTVAPHDDAYAKGRSKLGQGLVLTAPGIPAMLQGTEWLEDTDFGAEEPNRIDWGKKTTYAGIFAYYRDLIGLRTASPALRADAGADVFHLNESGNVIAFQRYDLSGNILVIVANFSNADFGAYRLGLPQGGAWLELINSQDPAYDGDGPTNAGGLVAEAVAADGFAQSAEIALPAMGLLVLQPDDGTAVPGATGDVNGRVRMLGAYPNPFNPRVTIAYELAQAGPARVSIHDVSGRRVRTLLTGQQAAGERRIVWDGLDDTGEGVASGVYFVRIAAGEATVMGKVVLLR